MPFLLGIPLYVLLIGLLTPSTPSPASTPRPTCPRRPSGPHRRAEGIIWSVIISVIFGFILLVA